MPGSLPRCRFYFRRLARAVENVGLNEPNLCRGDVLRERRHSNFAQGAAPHDLLEFLVRSRRGIAQIRNRPAAHYVCAMATRTKCGKQYAALVNLTPGSRQVKRRRWYWLHHVLVVR